MPNPVVFVDIGPDGIVATHPGRLELPVLVAPVPEELKAENFNTIRPPLVAIGCMSLPETGFEFDSSFVSPEAKNRFTQFARLMALLQKHDPTGQRRFPPISVFGHTDPTGGADYNKMLSGRRARAVYGVLTRNVKIWDQLFLNPFGGDQWGMKAISKMLSIPLKPGEDPFFIPPEGEITDAELKKAEKEALKAYQAARGLPQTGAFPNEKTRLQLYKEYMDAICQDSAGNPFTLDPGEHFLAKGADKTGLRGDVQGCGEFNPVMLLSQAEEDLFQQVKELQEGRNAAYTEDRRVIAYVFKHDSVIDRAQWPCPESRSGAGQCRLRFWSDHKDRLKRGEDRRFFKSTRDTMACRFYHGFAAHSPCEAGIRLWRVRFRIDVPGELPQPLRFRRFVLKAGEAAFSPIIRGTTDEKGEIRIPVLSEKTSMTIRLDVWGALFQLDDEAGKDPPAEGSDTDRFEDEDKFVEYTFDAGALKQMSEGDDAAKQRLFNLGFGPRAPLAWTDQEFRNAVSAFKRTRKIQTPKGQDEGVLDDDTREILRQEHEVDPPEPAQS